MKDNGTWNETLFQFSFSHRAVESRSYHLAIIQLITFIFCVIIFSLYFFRLTPILQYIWLQKGLRRYNIQFCLKQYPVLLDWNQILNTPHVYLGLYIWLFMTRSKGRSWLSVPSPHADKRQHVPVWCIHKCTEHALVLSHVCHSWIMINVLRLPVTHTPTTSQHSCAVYFNPPRGWGVRDGAWM